jgi:hypothetical protein
MPACRDWLAKLGQPVSELNPWYWYRHALVHQRSNWLGAVA